MSKFPSYRHFLIELVFKKSQEINEQLINKIAEELITHLSLTVVHTDKYEFTEHGFTKCWILSQSHLIVHTWPEFGAIQVDLMTCSGETRAKQISDVIQLFTPESFRVIQ